MGSSRNWLLKRVFQSLRSSSLLLLLLLSLAIHPWLWALEPNGTVAPSASGGPCSALGQEKVALWTEQEKLQPLSTAVFSVNIVLLEWWLNPHCRGEKSISWNSLCQCLNLFIYLQKRCCYPDSSVSLCIFTVVPWFKKKKKKSKSRG